MIPKLEAITPTKPLLENVRSVIGRRVRYLRSPYLYNFEGGYLSSQVS